MSCDCQQQWDVPSPPHSCRARLSLTRAASHQLTRCELNRKHMPVPLAGDQSVAKPANQESELKQQGDQGWGGVGGRGRRAGTGETAALVRKRS